MGKFLRQSGLGLSAVAAAAGAGFVALKPPPAPASPPAAVEAAAHVGECPACRLQVFGRGGLPSRLGPDPRPVAGVATSAPSKAADPSY